jgi:hypothetical protein
MDHCDLRHWDVLAAEDQRALAEIRAGLLVPTLKNKRNTRLSELRKVMDTLRSFQARSEEDTWKRYLVSGFCEVGNALAVNVSQLHKVIYKCRSSVNGSLRRMGYSVEVKTAEVYEELFRAIPLLRHSRNEVRQWTIRMKSDSFQAEETSDDPFSIATGGISDHDFFFDDSMEGWIK